MNALWFGVQPRQSLAGVKKRLVFRLNCGIIIVSREG